MLTEKLLSKLQSVVEDKILEYLENLDITSYIDDREIENIVDEKVQDEIDDIDISDYVDFSTIEDKVAEIVSDYVEDYVDNYEPEVDLSLIYNQCERRLHNEVNDATIKCANEALDEIFGKDN